MLIVTLAAMVCVPDTVNFTPTPTLNWSTATDNTFRYWVYWSDPTVSPRMWYACSPLSHWTDEDGVQYRWGRDLSYPVQRCVNQQEVELDWAVKGENQYGTSPNFSNVVRICMPHLWHKPEVYR